MKNLLWILVLIGFLQSCYSPDNDPAGVTSQLSEANSSSSAMSSSVELSSSSMSLLFSSSALYYSDANLQFSSSSSFIVSASLSSASASSSSPYDSLLALCTERNIWDGNCGSGAVSSGGYWWSFSDNAQTANGGPGNSTSNFPAMSMFEDTVGPWVLENGSMMDVTFTINPTSYSKPYTGIGFNWLDPESENPISSHTLCVEYSLTGTVPVQIEISVDASVYGTNPYTNVMPLQATQKTLCFPYFRFSQEPKYLFSAPHFCSGKGLGNSCEPFYRHGYFLRHEDYRAVGWTHLLSA